MHAATAGAVPASAPADLSAATAPAQASLERAVSRARELGLSAHQVVWDDEPGKAITTVAEREGADIIVMSTHGRTGLARWVYGSVADQVLRTAAVPVLLVPAAMREGWPWTVPVQVLVALDSSSLAKEAVLPAMELARALNGKITLVTAVERPVVWASEACMRFDPVAEAAAAREGLERMAKHTVPLELLAGVHVAPGLAAEIMLQAARDRGSGVIAMATHGRGGISRLVVGSVAEEVLRSAKAPVLMVRGGAVRASSSMRESRSAVDGRRQLS